MDSKNREPEPLSLYSTPLGFGFPIQLPEGEYSIRVVDTEGNVIPESIKKMEVINPLRRGVEFKVIPADQWLKGQISNDYEDVIYALNGSIFYLSPHDAEEYNEYKIMRVSDPQTTGGSLDNRIWITLEPINNVILEISQSGIDQQYISEKKYWIEQTPTSALGYNIIDNPPESAAQTRNPDIVGFEIEIGPHQKNLKFQILENNIPLIGSERQIQIISTSNNWILFALPLLPISIIILLFIRQNLYTSKKSKDA
jgi:hypothetical protein